MSNNVSLQISTRVSVGAYITVISYDMYDCDRWDTDVQVFSSPSDAHRYILDRRDEFVEIFHIPTKFHDYGDLDESPCTTNLNATEEQLLGCSDTIVAESSGTDRMYARIIQINFDVQKVL